MGNLSDVGARVNASGAGAMIITEHAIIRYMQRIRPGADFREGREVLREASSRATQTGERTIRGHLVWTVEKPDMRFITKHDHEDNRPVIVTVLAPEEPYETVEPEPPAPIRDERVETLVLAASMQATASPLSELAEKKRIATEQQAKGLAAKEEARRKHAGMLADWGRRVAHAPHHQRKKYERALEQWKEAEARREQRRLRNIKNWTNGPKGKKR